jgi:hypothetical protein
VHLLGYVSPPASTPARNRPYVLPGLIEDLPMYRAQIDIRRAFRSAKALSKSTRLRVRGQRVEATVEDIHEVICVGY